MFVNISYFQKIFSVPIGYSDHTLGNDACCTAVSLGATVIEKHVTLNKKNRGPDHKISSNIEELDRQDSSLLLFTSYLLDENGDTTYTATETHDIINETLPALGFWYHLYTVNIPEYIIGLVDINVSFKFRPFRPMVIESNVPELLSNLPIFEIVSIHNQVEVIE